MITVRDLKPCFLVAARCSVHGGINYQHDKEQLIEAVGQGEKATWETIRTIEDKVEYVEARGTRSRFLRELTALGVGSVLGVLVPTDKEKELRELSTEWRAKINEFNSKSVYSKLLVSIMVFKIQGENEEALDSMLYDLKDTMEELKAAIKLADYKGIREVVQRLRGFSTVLPDSAAEKLVNAVQDARAQANMIRKALEKQGEKLEVIQKQISTSTVDLAAFAIFGEETASTAQTTSGLVVDNILQQAVIVMDSTENDLATKPDGNTSTVYIPENLN